MGTGSLVGRVRAFLATLLGCSAVFLPSGSDAAERQLIAVGDVKAFVDNDPGWCRSTVDVIVRSPTASPFRVGVTDRAERERLFARIRLALGEQCPAATTVRLIGFADSRRVFEGTASAENNWVLRGGPSPVAMCDANAAHGDDPQRTGTAAVADERINAELAMQWCSAAVKAEPKIARLWFQLGRAYWAAERFEEAIETFVESAKMGHGGALAYLGDATLYGVGGLEPNPEMAKGLYEQAAKAGFKPAAELAAEIVAGVEAIAGAKAAPPEPGRAGLSPCMRTRTTSGH